MNNQISEFTISFKDDSMRIANGIISVIYNKFQALLLLSEQHILIGDENNLFSIDGDNMKGLHAAIQNHWCSAA